MNPEKQNVTMTFKVKSPVTTGYYRTESVTVFPIRK